MVFFFLAVEGFAVEDNSLFTVVPGLTRDEFGAVSTGRPEQFLIRYCNTLLSCDVYGDIEFIPEPSCGGAILVAGIPLLRLLRRR